MYVSGDVGGMSVGLCISGDGGEWHVRWVVHH